MKVFLSRGINSLTINLAKEVITVETIHTPPRMSFPLNKAPVTVDDIYTDYDPFGFKAEERLEKAKKIEDSLF